MDVMFYETVQLKKIHVVYCNLYCESHCGCNPQYHSVLLCYVSDPSYPD